MSTYFKPHEVGFRIKTSTFSSPGGLGLQGTLTSTSRVVSVVLSNEEQRKKEITSNKSLQRAVPSGHEATTQTLANC